MSTIPELHRRSSDHFSRVVAAIPEDGWHNATPCTEWDVRDLLHHNVAENLWVPPIMHGETVESVGDRFEGDVLGEDPKGAWAATVDPANDAVEEPDAMTRTVHLSFGDVPGEEYVKQRIVDLVVHAWDLARGAGTPDRLSEDPELVDACLGWCETWKPFLAAASDYFDPPIESAPEADSLTRLLNVLGRRP